MWNNLKGKKNRKIILGHHLVKDDDFLKGGISTTHTDTCRWYLNPNKKKKSLWDIQHCPIFFVIIKKSESYLSSLPGCHLFLLKYMVHRRPCLQCLQTLTYEREIIQWNLSSASGSTLIRCRLALKNEKKKLNPACAGCIFKQALRQVYEGGGGGGGLSETSFRIKCFKMKTLHLVRIHFKMFKVNESGRENCSYFAFTFFF